MQQRERRVLIVTCYGHFMSHFNMLVFPALVLPLANRLDMTMGGVLGISFWMYLLFGLTALPWGLLADRWDARPLLIIFFLGLPDTMRHDERRHDTTRRDATRRDGTTRHDTTRCDPT